MLTLNHPAQLVPQRIIQETFHDHHTSISTGGRTLCNLRFSDDKDFMGGRNGELQDPTNTHVDRARAYGMEVTQKRKI